MMFKKAFWYAGSFALAALLCGLTVSAVHHGESGSGGATLSQTVNAAMDNALAVADRMLEFPLFILLFAMGILGAILTLVVERWGERRRLKIGRLALVTSAVICVFGAAIHADKKIAKLQTQVTELRSKVNAGRMGNVAEAGVMATTAAPAKVTTAPVTVAVAAQQTAVLVATAVAPATSPRSRTALMFDPKDAQRRLATTFTGVNLRPLVLDEAIDAVDVHIDSPMAQAYIALIDLRTPGLHVKVGGGLDRKTYTSTFARDNHCVVAINGEAGLSPQANSGLGFWKGHWMIEGRIMQGEDAGNRRPFLSFDKQNHAVLTPMAATERSVPPDSYNVIWGRLDAVIRGEVQTADERNRQPRTAMGIDRDGARLILMVVDGRQPGYSMGFTRAEVGSLLKAFGADNGMLCDEGGSSCMYTEKFGLVNAPSDGEERPTYTHFGVAYSETQR
jgi:hypothetical protein